MHDRGTQLEKVYFSLGQHYVVQLVFSKELTVINILLHERKIIYLAAAFSL